MKPRANSVSYQYKSRRGECILTATSLNRDVAAKAAKMPVTTTQVSRNDLGRDCGARKAVQHV